MTKMRVHNVTDRRHASVGSWEVEPLDIKALTDADIGRTVIYRDVGRAEAGTLSSFRKAPYPIVWARFGTGSTGASCRPEDLVFGVRTLTVEELTR